MHHRPPPPPAFPARPSPFDEVQRLLALRLVVRPWPVILALLVHP